MRNLCVGAGLHDVDLCGEAVLGTGKERGTCFPFGTVSLTAIWRGLDLGSGLKFGDSSAIRPTAVSPPSRLRASPSGAASRGWRSRAIPPRAAGQDNVTIAPTPSRGLPPASPLSAARGRERAEASARPYPLTEDDAPRDKGSNVVTARAARSFGAFQVRWPCSPPDLYRSPFRADLDLAALPERCSPGCR